MHLSDFSAFVIDILYLGMLLVKDQSSFYEIRSLAICINIKTVNWVNRKQLDIAKDFLEYSALKVV